MGAESTFNALPGPAKVILVVVGSGVSIFIGWQIYSAVKKRIASADSFKEKAQVDDEIKKLADKKIVPTYPNSTYTQMANQLFTLMSGYGSGATSMPAIFAKLMNNADMLKLIDAYGIRTLSSGKGNPTPDFTGTLAASISDELDPLEIYQVNKVIKARGITITF